MLLKIISLKKEKKPTKPHLRILLFQVQTSTYLCLFGYFFSTSTKVENECITNISALKFQI